VDEVADVVRGAAAPGARLDVFFGKPGTSETYQTPRTPRMYARDYFIISYIAEDGVRRLIGSPVSREEYERWNTEVREYERTRWGPGAQDK